VELTWVAILASLAMALAKAWVFIALPFFIRLDMPRERFYFCGKEL